IIGVYPVQPICIRLCGADEDRGPTDTTKTIRVSAFKMAGISRCSPRLMPLFFGCQKKGRRETIRRPNTQEKTGCYRDHSQRERTALPVMVGYAIPPPAFCPRLVTGN